MSKPISLSNMEKFKECLETTMQTKANEVQAAVNDAKIKAEAARSAALTAGGASAEFTLTSADWTEQTTDIHGEYIYTADITVSGIDAAANADVIFDIDSIDACLASRVAATCNISAGKVTIYAKTAIGQPISGVVVYANNSNGTGIGKTNSYINLRNYIPAFGGWYNTEITDDNGNASAMVRIPKFTWKDVGVGDSDEIFPAFKLSNGQYIQELYIGKYEANNTGSSVLGTLPKVNINFDAAVTLCENKGNGWHLVSRLTWMAVALWCAKHNCQPTGNISSSAAVKTGTGSVSYSHNGKANGIWDLCGNVNEWVTGIRFVQGELQVISADGTTFGNDACVVTDHSAASPYWYAIDGTTGNLITPNGSGTTANSLKMNSSGVWNTTSAGDYSGTIDNVTAASNVCETAKNMLIALGMMLPDGITTDGDYFYIHKDTECMCGCGDYWSHGSRAGVFCADGDYARSNSLSYVGLRAALCVL